MKISAKGRYALRVMTDLAHHDTGEYIPLKDISFRQEISLKYLEQVIALLCKEGLVQSMRGSGGGYRLSKRPPDYTTGKILRAAEGGLYYDLQEDGPSAGFWQGFYTAINNYLDDISLETLAESENAAGIDYCI